MAVGSRQLAEEKGNKSSIQFFYQNISFSLKKKSEIKKLILALIRKEKRKAGDISFIFCNDQFLLALNKKFLKHDTLTDVITFDYTSPPGPLSLKRRGGSEPVAIRGEIFISISRVKENAKTFGVLFENELRRVMIHGVLHLCGYKDKTAAQKKEMRKREDYYLEVGVIARESSTEAISQKKQIIL